MRAFARQAERESRGDPTALVLALDRKVRETWGEFESFPISIVSRGELLVTLSTPYMAYRRAVIDVVRTKRPLAVVAWVDAAVVSISPARLDSPDIAAVTLTRDGRDVPPQKSTLRAMTFRNGNGDEGMIHAGEVDFPMAAFAPGAAVVLTLLPHDGAPIVYTFGEAELATLK